MTSIPVTDVDGVRRETRAETIGGVDYPGVLIGELLESPVDPTGGGIRHTVGSGAAVALDPPNAAARLARIRCRASVATDLLYYRSDGVAPLSNGSNAFGYLQSNELILVKLVTPANWRMISSSGNFEVFVEWFNISTA